MSFLFVVLPFVYPWGRWEIVGTNQKHGGDKCCLGNKWQYLKLQFRACISTIIFCGSNVLLILSTILTGFLVSLFSRWQLDRSPFFLWKRTDGWWWLVRSISLSSHFVKTSLVFHRLFPSSISCALLSLCVNLFYILLYVPSNNNKSNPSASATVYRTASFAVIRLVWRLVIWKSPKNSTRVLLSSSRLNDAIFPLTLIAWTPLYISRFMCFLGNNKRTSFSPSFYKQTHCINLYNWENPAKPLKI